MRAGKAVACCFALGLLAAAFFSTLAGANSPKIQKIISPAGIEIWLAQESKVPVVALQAAWRGGSVAEPAGREGLAVLLMGLLDEGAGPYDAQGFQQRLEEHAIELGFRASRDILSLQLKTLSLHRDEAFRLLGLALTAPRLDQDAIERIRAQIRASLAAAAADPDEIAEKQWFATAFAGHAYARPPEGTSASVDAIGRDDLAAFFGKRLARDNLVIGVVGDIDAAEAGRLVDLAFKNLPARAEPLTVSLRAPAVAAKPMVVDLDIPQSVMVFGGDGIARNDPDYYAAYVMNYVLGGGGLTSRLFTEVREKRGLAYSIGTYFSPLDHGPVFMGRVASRNDQAAATLALIRAEVKRMRDRGLSLDELAKAKAHAIGAFPLEMTDNSRIAQRLVGMQLENLGIDYLDRYAELIGRVTAADVARVARRLLDPEKLNVVVVGRPAGIAN